MLNQDYTAKLLNLEDVILTNVKTFQTNFIFIWNCLEKSMDALALMFEIAPRLADAYRLKNEFLTALCSESSATSRERLKNRLFSAERMEPEEFRNCVRAYRNRFRELLNSMDVSWTNGYIEDCNNKTKC